MNKYSEDSVPFCYCNLNMFLIIFHLKRTVDVCWKAFIQDLSVNFRTVLLLWMTFRSALHGDIVIAASHLSLYLQASSSRGGDLPEGSSPPLSRRL